MLVELEVTPTRYKAADDVRDDVRLAVHNSLCDLDRDKEFGVSVNSVHVDLLPDEESDPYGHAVN
jgi:hypothetical protein